MLCDDLESAVGCCEGSKRRGYTHPHGWFTLQQKLTQHCKATIPPFYKQNSKKNKLFSVNFTHMSQAAPACPASHTGCRSKEASMISAWVFPQAEGGTLSPVNCWALVPVGCIFISRVEDRGWMDERLWHHSISDPCAWYLDVGKHIHKCCPVFFSQVSRGRQGRYYCSLYSKQEEVRLRSWACPQSRRSPWR